MSMPQSSARSSMPPMLVTASTRSRASPLSAPRAAMSERTPVEVSAWTAAMIFGDGWAVATRDVDHALAEEAVDRDDDDVAGGDGVDEGCLHPGRPGGRKGQGAAVVGA